MEGPECRQRQLSFCPEPALLSRRKRQDRTDRSVTDGVQRNLPVCVPAGHGPQSPVVGAGGPGAMRGPPLSAGGFTTTATMRRSWTSASTAGLSPTASRSGNTGLILWALASILEPEIPRQRRRNRLGLFQPLAGIFQLDAGENHEPATWTSPVHPAVPEHIASARPNAVSPLPVLRFEANCRGKSSLICAAAQACF